MFWLGSTLFSFSGVSFNCIILVFNELELGSESHHFIQYFIPMFWVLLKDQN